MVFTYKFPYGAHVIILFVLSLASLVLIWLKNPSLAGDTTFGSFGWCSPDYCLQNRVGYEYGTQVNKALTGGMMLWAMAIVFVFLTVLSVVPLLFVHENKALRTVGNRMFFLIIALAQQPQ